MSEWLSSKRLQITNAKRTLVCGWWECNLIQPLCNIVWRFLRKLKIELPYGPATPLLGIYLKETNTLTWKYLCIAMFIAALFIIAKIWTQPKCLSTHGKQIKKMSVCVYIYIYIFTYISPAQWVIKWMKFFHLQQCGWILRVLC